MKAIDGRLGVFKFMLVFVDSANSSGVDDRNSSGVDDRNSNGVDDRNSNGFDYCREFDTLFLNAENARGG